MLHLTVYWSGGQEAACCLRSCSQGDVWLEYELALVPDEQQNFPRLARAALARL